MIDENSLIQRREVLTKGLIGGFTALGLTGSVLANRLGDPHLHVSVVDTSDPLRIQRVSQLDIEITNNGPDPVRPSISTLRNGRQTRFYWDVIDDNTHEISPGETTSHRIQATNPGMAIPYGEKYVVIVENETGNKGTTFENTTKNGTELTSIRNPGINNWLVPPSQGVQTPFRWDISTNSEISDSTNVKKTNRGALFDVSRGDRDGSWTMAGLTQSVPFISSLNMTGIPDVLTDPPRLQSGTVCGLEIVDRSHRIWVVYSEVAERQQAYRQGEFDYHVEYIPASRGEATSFNLDLVDIYETHGWERPPTRPITIDGLQYQASTMVLHPFAAAYRRESTASMELVEITT